MLFRNFLILFHSIYSKVAGHWSVFCVEREWGHAFSALWRLARQRTMSPVLLSMGLKWRPLLRMKMLMMEWNWGYVLTCVMCVSHPILLCIAFHDSSFFCNVTFCSFGYLPTKLHIVTSQMSIVPALTALYLIYSILFCSHIAKNTVSRVRRRRVAQHPKMKNPRERREKTWHLRRKTRRGQPSLYPHLLDIHTELLVTEK